MCIELVMPSSHLILCRPLLLLPPIPPIIRVFSNELTLRMRWPKFGVCGDTQKKHVTNIKENHTGDEQIQQTNDFIKFLGDWE